MTNKKVLIPLICAIVAIAAVLIVLLVIIKPGNGILPSIAKPSEIW